MARVTAFHAVDESSILFTRSMAKGKRCTVCKKGRMHSQVDKFGITHWVCNSCKTKQDDYPPANKNSPHLKGGQAIDLHLPDTSVPSWTAWSYSLITTNTTSTTSVSNLYPKIEAPKYAVSYDKFQVYKKAQQVDPWEEAWSEFMPSAVPKVFTGPEEPVDPKDGDIWDPETKDSDLWDPAPKQDPPKLQCRRKK